MTGLHLPWAANRPAAAEAEEASRAPLDRRAQVEAEAVVVRASPAAEAPEHWEEVLSSVDCLRAVCQRSRRRPEA